MKQKFTLYLYLMEYGKPSFALFGSANCGDSNCTLVGPREVECDVPENWDARPAKISALNEERAKLAAKLTDIDRRINELLAIEA